MNIPARLTTKLTTNCPTRLAVTAIIAMLASSLVPASAADQLVKIKLSDSGDFLVPLLAMNLGYFKQEGLDVERVKIEDLSHEEFLLQEPLIKGQIDAAYHWFQHTVYGVRHNLPVKAVIMLNDAPGATVMVANHVKDQIKSAADFKGRNVAEGAGYATKSILTNYLAQKAGLPPHSYATVFKESEGRQAAVIQGLKDNKVDVMTFLEPMTSAVQATNMVTTLYDLTNKESTVEALGAAYPAQSILMSPQYIEAHPDTVQHLVNAFVRTMRYINSHTAEQIAEKLPDSYFKTQDRQAKLAFIRKNFPTFAKGDYSFSRASAQLVVNTILASDFDQSPEGIWRATVENPKIDIDQLYTNQFVEKAMKEIK